MVAATRGHVASVALLLGARPPAAVDLPRDDGATPLMMACFEGHTDVVRALLKGRPDVNRQVRVSCVALRTLSVFRARIWSVILRRI